MGKIIGAVRVAALYDIHANLPALDAVLAEVPEDATIVLGGDHVYGPFPAQTLVRLHGLGERAIWLRGNCDRELSEPGSGPASLDVLDWVREQLSREQVEFLRDLPAAVTVAVDGLGEVFFCHATPERHRLPPGAGPIWLNADRGVGWVATGANADTQRQRSPEIPDGQTPS